jgi:hypothetical protein
MDFVSGSTVTVGVAVFVLSMAAAAGVAVLSRAFDAQRTLSDHVDLVTSVYPIIGLIYGVFLGFTIVITWGHFQDAESAVMEEVTHVSELWRDAEPFPDSVRSLIHERLDSYVHRVVEADWDSMAAYGRASPEATEAYELVWRAYYTFEPTSGLEEAFLAQSLQELNDFGRARRKRGQFASARVQPLVRLFLIGGGLMTVLFSLLIPAKSVRFQALVTGVMAGLIAFSIFLALALQRPFSGDLSVDSDAFVKVMGSFDCRAKLAKGLEPPTC